MTSPHHRRALSHLLVWLSLASFFFIFSFSFSDAPNSGFDFGPAIWPQAVALMVAVVAVLNYRRDVKAAPVEDATPPDATPDRRRALVNLGGIFAIPLVYAAIIPVIGFYLATPLFLLAELLHLGERRPRQIAMIVIGVCLALCVVFVTLFYVAVPLGREGLFYDLNNAVVLLFRLG